jgi:hypothetical protein
MFLILPYPKVHAANKHTDIVAGIKPPVVAWPGSIQFMMDSRKWKGMIPRKGKPNTAF